MYIVWFFPFFYQHKRTWVLADRPHAADWVHPPFRRQKNFLPPLPGLIPNCRKKESFNRKSGGMKFLVGEMDRTPNGLRFLELRILATPKIIFFIIQMISWASDKFRIILKLSSSSWKKKAKTEQLLVPLNEHILSNSSLNKKN